MPRAALALPLGARDHAASPRRGQPGAGQELFEPYQKLSLSYHDGQRTGQLMSRLTNDLFWLAELFHYGPEDLLIGLLTFAGVFDVSLNLRADLTLVIFLLLAL